MNKNAYTTRERGAALLIFVVLFLFTSLSLVLTIAHGVYGDYVKYQSLFSSKESLYSAEAGIEDAIYRHRGGKNYSDTEQFTIMGTQASTTRTMNNGSYTIIAEGVKNDAVRKGVVQLDIGSGASFNFGLQSGNGGIVFLNTSSVIGNVFSNGTIEGSNNMVYGDIISAGGVGVVDSMHATGSVWAHTIDDSIVDKDAYYTTKIATVVVGVSYSGVPDQTPADMPIPDSEIDEWKASIQATGTIIASTDPRCGGGTYTIDTSMTLGHTKIECNVIFKKQGASTVITFTNNVWITGNVDFTSGPSIVASSSLGKKSVALIVDNESNRATSSKVTVNNATNFTSGDNQSYVFIVSMNTSAENGGAEKAIDLGQTTTGKALVYAPHGLIEIGQSTSLKEVTAYKIRLINSAQIIYESGLVNLLFTSGPGGGYTITSWNAIE